MKREDKRVQRTRRALSKALVNLTLEKGYEDITIQDITERAGIGYRTYFRHYADKDALLRDVLQATIRDLRDLLAPATVDENGAAMATILPAENWRLLFEHARDNSDFYRVLLRSGPAALEPLMALAYRETHSQFATQPEGAVPHDIIANHVVAAVFALMRWWLENDMPHSPERMGVYTAQLIIQPSRHALNERA